MRDRQSLSGRPAPSALRPHQQVDYALVAFGTLWELDKRQAPLTTFTIIIGQQRRGASPRPRMPVILDPAAYDAWLSGAAGREVLTPFPAERMRAYPVSTRVGSVPNNDAAIIEALNSA